VGMQLLLRKMREFRYSLSVLYADTTLEQPTSRRARSCYGPGAAD
jgi:hypothetical protein